MWELPPSLYWSTSCTTLWWQSVQQTWLQQRIWSNPTAWGVSGTDYIHHAIRVILFQTTSFRNQFRAWSLPQGNDSYPALARSHCRHWWHPHLWKKLARTRWVTAISIGKNARSRCHTQWEVCLFRFLGHIISQEGINVDLAKVEAITNLPRPTNIEELQWLLGMVNHTGKFAPDLADTIKPLRDLLKKENSWTWDTRDSISNTQETAEYRASVGKLQSWKGNKSVCRCIRWTRRSPTPERRTGLEASLLCVQIADRHGAEVCPGGEVTWCCEKFYEFLIGLKMFMIETNHKPLLALLKTKHLDELTPRI